MVGEEMRVRIAGAGARWREGGRDRERKALREEEEAAPTGGAARHREKGRGKCGRAGARKWAEAGRSGLVWEERRVGVRSFVFFN